MDDHTRREPSVPVTIGLVGGAAALARSLSPRMFAAAFREAGMPHAYYVPLPVRDSTPAKAMRSLARLGFRGANVTTPYKRLAAEVAADASDDVLVAAAANTLVVTRGGRLRAEATDGDAVVEALQDAGVDLAGASTRIHGAGGAASQVAVALARAEVASIRIVNRSEEPARMLADRLHVAFPALALQVGDMVPIDEPAHVIVSAVPAEAAPVDTALQHGPEATIVDLAYRHDGQPTALVVAARAVGAPVIDGRELLVRQGALAFRHWFGAEPSREAMIRAVG